MGYSALMYRLLTFSSFYNLSFADHLIKSLEAFCHIIVGISLPRFLTDSDISVSFAISYFKISNRNELAEVT